MYINTFRFQIKIINIQSNYLYCDTLNVDSLLMYYITSPAIEKQRVLNIYQSMVNVHDE